MAAKAAAIESAGPVPAVAGDSEAILTLMQVHHKQLMERLESWMANTKFPANKQPPETAAATRFASQPSSSSSDMGMVKINSTAERAHRLNENLCSAEEGQAMRETWQGTVRWHVFNLPFEIVLSVMIVSNTLLIAFEVEWEARFEEQGPWPFTLASFAFALFFLLELLLRIAAEGPTHFFTAKQNKIPLPPNGMRSRRWNWFDFFLVLVSVIEMLLVGGFASWASNFRFARMTRFLRIARITRVVRLVRFVHLVPSVCAFRVLLVSILSTLSSCAWASVLLLAVFYFFGIIFTQAANDFFLSTDTQDCAPEFEFEDDVCLVFKKYWGNIPRSMLTLFEAVFSGVDWNIVARPLGRIGTLWTLVFLVFIAIVYLAVLNTLTGVVVHSAIENAQRNREWLVQHLLCSKQSYADSIQDQFVAMFNLIDAHKTGLLSLVEFERHLHDPEVQAYFALLELETPDLYTLFRLLDRDGNNMVDVEEFVEGSVRLKGQARSIDLAKLQADTRHLSKKINQLSCDMDERMDHCLRAVQALVDKPPFLMPVVEPWSSSPLSWADPVCASAETPLRLAVQEHQHQRQHQHQHQHQHYQHQHHDQQQQRQQQQSPQPQPQSQQQSQQQEGAATPLPILVSPKAALPAYSLQFEPCVSPRCPSVATWDDVAPSDAGSVGEALRVCAFSDASSSQSRSRWAMGR